MKRLGTSEPSAPTHDKGISLYSLEKLALGLFLMRPITERLIFREAAPAELWVLDGAGDIAISIDEVHGSSDANRSALGIDEDLDVLSHLFTFGFSRDNREGLVSVMGDVASTLSLTQSDECAHE